MGLKIALLLVLVPAVLLVSMVGAVRFCLWVMGDGGSEQTARDGNAKAPTIDKPRFPRQSSA